MPATAAPTPPTPPTPGGAFTRFWTAVTLSAFGTAVTTVAMPVLVVQTLGASPLEVGVVNAAQLAPYAVLGLLAGALLDRWRRRPVLVWASLGRAAALAAIAVLGLLGVLQVGVLVVLLLAFGSFSVFAFAATQSLLPRVVPRERLVVANARLDQGDAAAQTFGPAIGGGLVGLLGAPVAIAVDAVSYVVDALLNAGLRVEEERPVRTATRSMRREIGEGLRWTYRHRVLGPLALSTHTWFLAHAAGATTLSVLALREMGLSAAVFGLLVAAGGVAALVGAGVAPAVGRLVGTGPAVIGARAVYPAAWSLVWLAPATSQTTGAVLIAVALAVSGAAGSVENAHDTSLWQRITPDHLLGRANATRRSANRTIAAVGAVLAGISMTVVGERPTLVAVVIVYAAAAAIAAASPLRHVRHTDPT